MPTAKLLDKIDSKEALPLILFKGKDKYPELPSTLGKAVIAGGNMIYGTEFGTKQMLFCAGENPDEKCLVRKDFYENQGLKCLSETPVVIQMTLNSCHTNKNAYIYASFYKVHLA